MTRDTTRTRTDTRTPALAPRGRTPETTTEWLGVLALTLAPVALLWATTHPLPAAAAAAVALAAVTTARTARTVAERLAGRRLTLPLPGTEHRLTLVLTGRR